MNAKLNDIVSRAFEETWETAQSARRADARCGVRRRSPARRRGDDHPRHLPVAADVVIYHAEGCHLCERALEQVRALQAELGFDLREVDITGDDALEAEYREWLPVVEIDGRRRFTYHVQADSFRPRLHKQAPSPSCYNGPRCYKLDDGGCVADRLTVGVAARLSRYLQVLTQARKMGKARISSQEIAEYTNINATQIRRDLSAFGKFGKRGVGYNIESLLGEIRKILRTQGQHNIALIGAGRLGQAIASSAIFAEHGINIAAVFDTDPEKLGQPVGHVTVSEYGRLADLVREKNIIVGVLAVPAEAAQKAADDLVASGVKIIFNYSEALLETPADVTVHTSNPAVELLYALYFHLT